MREYEVMLILPAEADEKVVGTAVDRITKAIEPSGGTVGNIDRWGRRRLAFEIDRQTEAYYAVVAFDAEPAMIAPLERVLTLADEVLRAKVTIRHQERARIAEKPKGTARRSAAAPRPAVAAASESQVASPETAETETSPTPA